MSTRCNIHFCHGSSVEANIYRHGDGYPSSVLPDLTAFFEAVEAQCDGDNRFDDPAYLAAKFVVWQAERNRNNINHSLGFLSLGIVSKDAEDGEYIYDVHCGDRNRRPDVTHREH